MPRILFSLCFLLSFLVVFPLLAQKMDDEAITKLIQQYKEDPRGPYHDIRWFCKDGSVIPPKETCPEPGGVQRARYKKETIDLAKSNHIFLGQILATTEFSDFWDAGNNHARLKQYQLENYLKKIDDGWVNRKGQFYRGAYQIEDEVAWGIDFYKWLLGQEAVLRENFFLLRESTKDIPHRADTDRSQRIRALSKVIADNYSPFMDLRIKIHGQPDAADLPQVIAFSQKHDGKLKETQKKQLQELIQDMEVFYGPVDINNLKKQLSGISSKYSIYETLETYLNEFQEEAPASEKVKTTAQILLDIRKAIIEVDSRSSRLALLDLSTALEEIYFKAVGNWNATNISEITSKIEAAGKAATGAGYLELWEWQALAPRLQPILADTSAMVRDQYLADARRLVEWGAGMTRAVYDDVVERFRPFEPKAYGFIDDRVRSSVLLDLGKTVGTLGEMIAETEEGTPNYLLSLSNASHARGLNPGFALGELVVLESTTEDMEVDKNKIYVFARPPSDLKPVAGIATVTEGNLVSHVQLLARNLAIPNAVISDENFRDLKPFSGEKVFYAVTSAGRVMIKPESEMNDKERKLFEKEQRSDTRVEVPIDRIDLAQTKVLNMRNVDASSSGVVCGPKAANLGQLKKMFPEQVVEGIVIPFGIFREHLNQNMPGQETSYWEFLNQTFDRAETMRSGGKDEGAISNFLLEQLSILRAAIKEIVFYPEFLQDLKQQFASAFGKEIGAVPVFVRSDTNMEDLKDFTGAGLNLTLFNIVEEDRILEGIKEVWASPYTERSFKWRQSYLLNPENVFPSILIIPSVDVDFSGVLITKGITSGNENDLTLAISRGAGGAVDGQAAESYLLRANGKNELLTPAREPSFRRLPSSGGTSKNIATFERSIAQPNNLKTIRDFAREVETIFPQATGTEPVSAYDIEFGFADDKLWLFQIRPFVESKSNWEELISGGSEGPPGDGSPASGKSLIWWILIVLGILAIGGFAIWYIRNQSIQDHQKN